MTDGLQLSIAFLSSLRTNLQICAADPEDIHCPSPLINTPNTLKPPPRFYQNVLSKEFNDDAAIQIPLGSGYITEKSDHGYEIDLPPPTTSVTICHPATDEDTTAALELTAESVSQQRQVAVKAIILHPTILAITILIFLTTVKLLYTGSLSDMILMMTAWVVCSVFALLVIKYMLRGYSDVVERVGSWPWLSESSIHGASHKRDEILVAKENGEVIGVLVLRIAKAMTAPGIPGVRPRSARRKSSARWTGIIRAWTVKRTHRGQGIGTRLLRDVVANCRLRTLDGPIFADDHANSAKLLPRMFNVVFEKQEKWAREVLERTIIAERGL